MQTGLTLQQFAAKIAANKELKRDYISDTRRMAMVVQEDRMPVLELHQQGTFPLMETAHQQIGSRLKIPRDYYNRMRVEAPALLASNVNTWFASQPEKRMVRTLGGDARAFLSDRYNRIDNEQIVAVAIPVLAAIPDLQIISAEVTDRRMYIQATTPRIAGEVKRGDVVQAGVIISNSEIGKGSVSVAAMDYRLVCLNGMVSTDKFRAFHVGRQVEDSEELWRDDTRQADDRAVLLKVRDMVVAAVDAVRFRERLDKMTGLTSLRVEGNVAAAVQVLSDRVGADLIEADNILKALINGGDLSAWGLVNAVTAQAHGAESYDRAVEFEAAGGQLLDLPRSAWKEILEAA